MSPILLTGALAALAASLSFYAEFGLRQPPCFLCLVQRALWLSLLSAAILSPFFKTFAKKLILILLALNLCAASYHTLVQLKLVEDRCKTALQPKDAEAYASILEKGRRRGCSAESWRIGKMPAPMINGVVCLSLLYFIWYRRN